MEVTWGLCLYPHQTRHHVWNTKDTSPVWLANRVTEATSAGFSPIHSRDFRPMQLLDSKDRILGLDVPLSSGTFALAGKLVVTVATTPGRKSGGVQEDRVLLFPSLLLDPIAPVQDHGGAPAGVGLGFLGDMRDYALFGVCDGTTGDHAAQFVQDHFVSILRMSPAFRGEEGGPSKAREQANNNDLTREAQMHRALGETFREVDAALARHVVACSTDGDIHPCTGCTAVVALVYLPTLLVAIAHAGDSEAIVGSRDSKVTHTGNNDSEHGDRSDPILDNVQAQSLTPPHLPNNPIEQKRIESAGGQVVLHRRNAYRKHSVYHMASSDDYLQKHGVGRSFAWSRGFGGGYLKTDFGMSIEPGLCAMRLMRENQLASAVRGSLPDLEDGAATTLCRGQVLILASDGLWERITPLETVLVALRSDVMQPTAGEGEGKFSEPTALSLAERLVQGTITRGTKDNVSVITLLVVDDNAKREA